MSYATLYMLRERPFQATPEVPKRKRWFDLPLIELLRPNGYWPAPFSIEQAFEAYRWMVSTGTKYSSPGPWGRISVSDLLSAGSGIGTSSPDPIMSVSDLRQRFHYAVLGRASSEAQERWRQDFGIAPDSTVRIKVPVYRPFEGANHLGWRSEAEIFKALNRLLGGEQGHHMAVSLNSIHQDCRWLHGVRIIVVSGIFYFQLRYGDPPDPKTGYSAWDETIAHTREGETFLDTLARARDVYDVLVHGAAKPCDIGDLDKAFRPEHVLDQVAALTAGGAL